MIGIDSEIYPAFVPVLWKAPRAYSVLMEYVLLAIRYLEVRFTTVTSKAGNDESEEGVPGEILGVRISTAAHPKPGSPSLSALEALDGPDPHDEEVIT